MRDRLIGAALALGAVLYLAALPRPLGRADEAFFLYHAKRILEGQVVFRDFHELYMPLAHYGMALLFALFGVTRDTATFGAAALHGATTWLAFRVCRAAGVRRALAALTGLAYLAVCQPAWPFASPHWLGTFFMLAVLWGLLARNRGDPRRGHWVLGALVGALFCAQHQNGGPAALGAAAVVALDAAWDRRFGAVPGSPPAWAKLVRLVAGAGAVVGAFLLLHFALAGPGPVLQQIFIDPFTKYRAAVRGAPWGSGLSISAVLLPYTFPLFLKYLPVLVPLGAARAARAWSAGDRDGLERQAAFSLLGSALMLSIWYHPDFIHIAFIAPPLLVFGAECCEAGLRRLARRPRWTPAVAALGTAAPLLLAVPLGLHLRDNAGRLRAWFPHPIETAFGVVDAERPGEGALVRGICKRLDAEPRRELLAYPLYISMYLMADADNPSPHDYNLPGYVTPGMVQEVLDAVVARELRYVLLMDSFIAPGDPIVRHVLAHYRCIGLDRGRCVLYERRPPG